MSNRNEDPGLLSWLRDLSSRLDRLEMGDKGVRVNDTRLGNSVLTPNTYTNQVEMKNLGTGDMIPLSGVRDVVWSWSGALEAGADSDSPPACIPDETVANEIVISRTNTDGACNIGLIFPGGFTIYTGLAAGKPVHSRPIHIALPRNSLVYVQLLCASGGIANVSVCLRFGQPTGQEDNVTVESVCA